MKISKVYETLLRNIMLTPLWIATMAAITDRLDVLEGAAVEYLEYTALISQVSTSIPTVIILKNTLGTIVWSRNSSGSYTGTLASAFVSDKTFLQLQENNGEQPYITRTSANAITITCLGDGSLVKNSLQIKVYT